MPTPLDQAVPLVDLKRLLECHHADPGLIERLRADAAGVFQELGFGWDPQALAKLWDPERRSDPDHPTVTAYYQHLRGKLALREQVRREGSPTHPRLRAWRERQVARCGWHLGEAQADAIVHPPWCVELTQGCSVGCWFCGLGAQGLKDVYAYTPEHRREWAEILELMAEVLGPGARWGFGYWATDPLDNPDYERFMLDFARRLGMFPQTTTAQAWRHPERVRALLALSEQHGCEVNRFSVLTRAQLEKLHRQFTPQELGRVEMVLQNREATNRKALAGNTRDDRKRRSDKTGQVVDTEGTIACVSGFVLRMVERTVELVTPCPSSERWPNGYYVLAHSEFGDIAHLRRLLNTWVDQLPLTVSELRPLRLARDVQCPEVEGGLRLVGRWAQLNLTGPGAEGPLRALAARLRGGGAASADELALLGRFQEGVPEAQTLSWLKILFDRGWLDEEPERD